MGSVVLRCPECHSSFKVLEDELFDHGCPICGQGEWRNQPEHCGDDYFGDEILEGNDIVEFDGETILKDNLERFLSEKLGFEFKTAD